MWGSTCIIPITIIPTIYNVWTTILRLYLKYSTGVFCDGYHLIAGQLLLCCLLWGDVRNFYIIPVGRRRGGGYLWSEKNCLYPIKNVKVAGNNCEYSAARWSKKTTARRWNFTTIGRFGNDAYTFYPTKAVSDGFCFSGVFFFLFFVFFKTVGVGSIVSICTLRITSAGVAGPAVKSAFWLRVEYISGKRKGRKRITAFSI